MVKKYYQNIKKKESKMKNIYRDHNCGELNIKNVGQNVKLAGWVQRIRNLGAMKFIDLRDEFGITQLVISDEEKLKDIKENLVTECVICVEGKVLERNFHVVSSRSNILRFQSY